MIYVVSIKSLGKKQKQKQNTSVCDKICYVTLRSKIRLKQQRQFFFIELIIIVIGLKG